MENLQGLAFRLVNGLVSAHQAEYGFGSMTCAVYDTAWLSMVAKPAGSKNWLFPSSFSRVIEAQKTDTGGWMELEDTDTDIVLNTAAALLALCKHRGSDDCPGVHDRIAAASRFLRSRLQMLDLSTSIPLPVGFELLLPALLDLLDLEEVTGISSVHFPARKALLDARDRKLARIDMDSILANKSQSTLLHSLEAFTGRVDFDRLKGHTIMGSMMASPAATAAALINSTKWNNECEQYLRHVIKAGSGSGDGSVPSAFPSTYFETSWVIATLLESGFDLNDLGLANLELAKKILEDGFVAGSGKIGFARHLEPDGDDTAKGMTVLNLLGVPTSVEPLIRAYYNGSYFITYKRERDASITTNCNALTALCVCPDPGAHAGEIEMAMRFICKTWWHNTDRTRDKWSTSTSYTLMLTAQSLVKPLDLWARGQLPKLPLEILENGMIVLLQLLVRLLRTQSEDGLWEGKREATAYSVLALSAIACLSIVSSTTALIEQIYQAIRLARAALSRDLATLSTQPAEHLWIEKVTYGSQNLSQAYILAALKSAAAQDSEEARTTSQDTVASRVLDLLPASLDEILKPVTFFNQLPIFSDIPNWCTQASLIEGSLFRRRLRNECLHVFPERTVTKEKHLSFIPFTWTSVNNLHGGALGSHAMFGMMIISALAYQVDEFIESEVASLSCFALTALKTSIRQMFTDIETETDFVHVPQVKVENGDTGDMGSNGTTAKTQNANGTNATETEQEHLSKIQLTIKRFMRFVWDAPYTRNAAAYSRAQLKNNMRDYLVAHISQTEDSRRLPREKHEQYQDGKALSDNIIEDLGCSLLTWTRTTSGDHTVGSLAVSVLTCILGSQQGVEHDLLGSPQAKYVASDMARHLAAVARLYNDLGSIPRDRVEGNFNSANFPEFEGVSTAGPGEERMPAVNRVKAALLRVAEYEKRCLQSTMVELKNLLEDDMFAALEALCASTELYCQMYLLKDMTPAVKR